MDEIPLTVTIPIPSKADRRGAWATTPPNGRALTIRVPGYAYDQIEEARVLLDEGMSIGRFMGLCAQYAVERILKHR